MCKRRSSLDNTRSSLEAVLATLNRRGSFPIIKQRILVLALRHSSTGVRTLGVGLVVGTLTILGMFLVLSGAFTGLGLLVRRVLGPRPGDIDHYFLAFWTGFG